MKEYYPVRLIVRSDVFITFAIVKRLLIKYLNHEKIFPVSCVFVLASLLRAQNKLELISPNGELKVFLNLSDKIYYSIDYNGDVLLKDNTLQLTLRNQVLGRNPKLRRQKRTSVDEQLTPIVPLKYAKVNNRYNQLLLTFKDYSVEFRAFDDGVAYRFITSQKR